MGLCPASAKWRSFAPTSWTSGRRTPPIQTEEELRTLLQSLYQETHLHVDGSMVYFHCVK